VVVDKAWFDALPADQRKAISESIDEMAQRQWKEAIEEDRKLVQKMVAQGAVYRTAPAAEVQRWKERAASVNKAFTEKNADTFQKITALEKSCGTVR
jgi:C4-dicarboxylate-binding protein DctP